MEEEVGGGGEDVTKKILVQRITGETEAEGCEQEEMKEEEEEGEKEREEQG